MCFNGLPGGAADEELQAREACLEPDGAVYAADEELQADAVGGRGGCGGRAGGGAAAAASTTVRAAAGARQLCAAECYPVGRCH